MVSESDRRAKLAHAILGEAARERLPPSTGVLLATDMQKSLWIDQTLEPASCAYNSAMALEVFGSMDPELWSEALRWAVRRMPTLDAIYADSAAGVGLVPASDDAIAIPLTERRLSEDADLGRIAQNAAMRPFDLRRERPFRAEILRAANDRWILLLCAHHIAWDGTSLKILLDLLEAGLSVQAAASGPGMYARETPTALAAPRANAETLTPARRIELLAMAEAHFAGIAPDAAPLICAQTAAGTNQTDRDFFTMRLPNAVIGAADDLARRLRCSRFHVLLASLTATSFFQGQAGMFATILVQDNTKPSAGYGLKRLLMGLPNARGLSFASLMERCRDAFIDALELAALSEADLRKAFTAATGRPDFPMGRNLLSYDISAHARVQLGGLPIRLHFASPTAARAQFAMSIIAEPSGADLSLRLEAKPVGGVARDLREFGERYLADLDRLIRCADRTLDHFPPAHMKERRRLVKALNASVHPAPESVPAQLMANVLRFSAELAVASGTGCLSYRELYENARDWHARIFAVAGHRPGPRVVLAGPRDARTISALWGIWMAGGAAVLLDPASEDEEISNSLGRITPICGVGPRACPLRQAINAFDLPWLDLESMADAAPGKLPAQPNPSEASAYFVLTSGSTGGPKVVEISHGNLAETLAAARFEGMPARPVTTWSARLAFDIALLEILLPLSLGGHVHIHNADPVDVERLAQDATTANVFHAVPAVMRKVLKAVGPDPGGPGLALVGGDKVSSDLIAQMRAAWPQSRIRVLYGPTETTIICASAEIGPEDRFEAPIIGRPHRNVRLRIVDENGRSVPVGAPGELLIGGPVVGRYAVAEPDQQKRFIVRGAFRYFRTGDLVRIHRDGIIEFLGRNDAQEKIDGVRVMPETVEAMLREEDNVEEAAVVGYDVAPDVRRLMAFYRVKPGAPQPEISALRARLAARLPHVAVPAHFEPISVLPLNRNDKIDHKVLARLAQRIGTETAKPAQATEMQAMIAAAWASVLDRPVNMGDQSFMALGGDSLAMSRLRLHLQERFGKAPPLAALMARPTIAGMAELLNGAPATAMPLAEAPDSAPLTAQQERIWDLLQYLPLINQMTVSCAFELSQACEPTRLEEAIRGCMKSHDALTVRIEADDRGRPIMRRRMQEEIDAQFALGTAREASAEAAQMRLKEFFDQGFDLTSDLPVRFLIVERPGPAILAIHIHHIVTDGWSIRVILEDIVRRYEQMPGDGPTRASPSFLHYARVRATTDPSERARSYQEHLDRTAGAAVSLFDPTRSGQSRASFIVGRRRRRLGEFDAATIERVAARVAVTPFVVGLAAYAAVVADIASVRTLRVATMCSNRDSEAVESLIGLVANTILVDIDTAIAVSAPDRYLQAVGTRLAESLAFQNVLASDLDACVAARGRDLAGYRSAFQFGLLDHGGMAVTGRALALTALDAPAAWISNTPEFKLSGYELATDLKRWRDVLELTATYQVDVFSSAEVDAILARIEAALCGFAEALL
ncbi:condensation domain-containing protein [Bradyrhizobium sp. SZCCHNR1051]|uniref:condensation domain-containing protein n=1 Tax=Bradyrhizobium sp. SZCCHNR1051 TaxID=3057355 RepID=UPI00291624F6|nr:condensation domain-containing protein [Bradyrhizobium sp. SZCCHNR1051]